MKGLFHIFPTVEEEVYNLKRYYRLHEQLDLLIKLTRAFFITSGVSWIFYYINEWDVNSYKIKSFSFLSFLFTLGLAVLLLIHLVLLRNLIKKSYQFPQITKECVNVSVNDLYQLLTDDFSIHEKVKQAIARDEILLKREDYRFDLICDMHFFMWRTLNEYAYEVLIDQKLSCEEVVSLQQEQKMFKEA